jgi:hypothetical protein
MRDQDQPAPKYSAFWDRMDQNAEYGRRLPDWVKGTSANERPAVVEPSAPVASAPREPRSRPIRKYLQRITANQSMTSSLRRIGHAPVTLSGAPS